MCGQSGFGLALSRCLLLLATLESAIRKDTSPCRSTYRKVELQWPMSSPTVSGKRRNVYSGYVVAVPACMMHEQVRLGLRLKDRQVGVAELRERRAAPFHPERGCGSD